MSLVTYHAPCSMNNEFCMSLYVSVQKMFIRSLLRVQNDLLSQEALKGVSWFSLEGYELNSGLQSFSVSPTLVGTN